LNVLNIQLLVLQQELFFQHLLDHQLLRESRQRFQPRMATMANTA